MTNHKSTNLLVAAMIAMAATSAFADDCAQDVKVAKPHVAHVKKHKATSHKHVKPKAPIVETKTMCEVKKPEQSRVDDFPFPPPGNIVPIPMPLPAEPEVAAVPEPSSIAMVLTGILFLTMFTRRKK